MLVDSRYRLLEYRDMTICTPKRVGSRADARRSDWRRRADRWSRPGHELLRRFETAALLITRGSRGMALFQPKQSTIHIPIFGSDEVADVTGAGDTVIATVALALAAGASFYEAARLGELRRRTGGHEAGNGHGIGSVSSPMRSRATGRKVKS